jgi:predicted amidohydrolase
MSQLAIGGLQLEVGHQNNLYAIQNEIETALRQFPWLDMIVVGELASYGSKPSTAQPIGGEADEAYQALAEKHGIWLVPGSYFEQRGSDVYNTAPVISPEGEIVQRYRKIYPFVPYESASKPGDSFVVFDVPGRGRIGLCICYDIWFPEVARTLAWMGAEVIVVPTMTNTIDREVELCLARSTAATNQCYVMSLNVTGRLGVGQSITVDPNGTVLHQAGGNQELISMEVDFEQVRRSRERGVLGLCQALKSFRDSEVVFPPYAAGARSEYLDNLGPVKMPEKADDNALE